MTVKIKRIDQHGASVHPGRPHDDSLGRARAELAVKGLPMISHHGAEFLETALVCQQIDARPGH